MSVFSAVLIGDESLAIQCGKMLLSGGHQIGALVTRNPENASWASGHSIGVFAPGPDLATNLAEIDFDWLLSVANLDLIRQPVLNLANKGAVNFHDGPLPGYAGLNAPVWALMGRERAHGVAWHLISDRVDAGDIIAQTQFGIDADETALTLNTKCYSAAIDTFATVISELASDRPNAVPQDLGQRSYFGKHARPAAAARLDFTSPAADIAALVRALDHGDYWNPLCCPKFDIGGQIWFPKHARIAPDASGAPPGTIVATDPDALTIATATDDIILSRFKNHLDQPTAADQVASVGAVVPSPDAAEIERIEATLQATLPHEATWRARLQQITALDLALGDGRADTPLAQALTIPKGATLTDAQCAFVALMAGICRTDSLDLSLHMPQPSDSAAGYTANWVPIRIMTGDSFSATRADLGKAIEQATELGGFACDLLTRMPTAPTLPLIGLSRDPATGCLPGTAFTLAASKDTATLLGDPDQVDTASFDRMVARLNNLLQAACAAPDQPLVDLPLITHLERQVLTSDWNNTDTKYRSTTCIHTFFEEQADRTPDAEAVVFEDQTMTYSQLNARANQVAHTLRDLGIKPGNIIGLHMPRCAEMLVAALGILKAGGAYLPMDPTYPADRNAHYINDSQSSLIVTQSDLLHGLPNDVQTLCLDTATELARAPTDNPDIGVAGDDLAYMIYTSGSTGHPKGVLVEHRNVSNFFTGMDAIISHDPPGVWLAVTSLSFDISVLELFWTLARGFKVVISGDQHHAPVAGHTNPAAISARAMDFSLFYWGNDDGVGRGKYRLLLEGAKFADQNGFCAVWTPERHFHAFGGPYPNPSVTGAAVAAVTENISVRAGSCVAPLHHTARIAEEWAVIDNLTNGRAGLSIASGWQPDDFVLQPENTPPQNKPAMFRAIDDLRKLWQGEAVEFARQDGTMFPVVTQPRPISKTLDIWVTTAGNPETWRQAGTNGTHILTHLLGQTVDEVADKITLYHDALRAAGHNPDDFKVTMMLHSYIAETTDIARETARQPMKDYLRAAAGLIKQYAWAFPAFKRPTGASNPFEIDLDTLDEDEMDAILEFAFQRYFTESGLFGTVNDALLRVEQLKRIGVTEVACLIDFGIDTDLILASLKPLAQVLHRSNAQPEPASDTSIAAQITRHNVTHMQCTPSMAQMLLMDDDARAALTTLQHILIGGEALSTKLAADLSTLIEGPVENMYGPTETTIWSTTDTVNARDPQPLIGRPIANTQAYVLDDHLRPLPTGTTGELYIGGAGVARGYWRQPDLTRERFIPDPFDQNGKPGRLYRTGDLARWHDGRLEYLGRSDHQIKLRGHRVELGEIEAALDNCDGVRQSIVIARPDGNQLTQLVGYLVMNTPLSDGDLKAQLATKLPDHMIPARFVTLQRFPMTPNQKVDRKALPAPQSRASAQPAITAETGAQGSTAQKIAAIWSQILDQHNITKSDNFFDLGGHSLLAVQAHREIKKTLDVQSLTITDIFRFPVLGALAKAVDGKIQISPAQTDTPADEPSDTNDVAARRREMRARRAAKPA